MIKSSWSDSSSVTVLAPAKINLILRVLDRRSDGYHNLWSLMQTVALEDEIRISPQTVSGDIRLRCNVAGLATDRSNLVYRAAAAVLDRAGSGQGLDIDLVKRIPMGAGLGGGSSDAAATIRALNQALCLGWSAETMSEVGQALGSDVPFFFYAPSGCVWGRGELVKPIRLQGSRWIVLVNPGFPVETRWAYQQLTSTRAEVRPLSPAIRDIEQESALDWSRATALAENDFEEAVFSAYPLLRRIKQDLLAQGAETALLSGSGATVYGVFTEEATARRAKAILKADRRFTVFAAPTCSGPLVVASATAVESPLG